MDEIYADFNKARVNIAQCPDEDLKARLSILEVEISQHEHLLPATNSKEDRSDCAPDKQLLAATAELRALRELAELIATDPPKAKRTISEYDSDIEALQEVRKQNRLRTNSKEGKMLVFLLGERARERSKAEISSNSKEGLAEGSKSVDHQSSPVLFPPVVSGGNVGLAHLYIILTANTPLEMLAKAIYKEIRDMEVPKDGNNSQTVNHRAERHTGRSIEQLRRAVERSREMAGMPPPPSPEATVVKFDPKEISITSACKDETGSSHGYQDMEDQVHDGKALGTAQGKHSDFFIIKHTHPNR